MSAKTKIRVSLFISIVLFILIKLTLPEPRRNKLHKDAFWISKTHGNDKYNIVVCGDSRIYRGFSIKDLEGSIEEKLSGINLGYSSAGFSVEYLDFALSRLNKNAEVQILVLGITPHSLTKEAFKNSHYNSITKMGKTEINEGLYLSPFLRHFEPYEPFELFEKNKSNYIQEIKSHGWIASSYVIPKPTDAIASYQNTFSKYQVTDKEVNTFFQKIEEITSEGIMVIAFRPPSSNEMQMLEDTISGFNEELVKNTLIEKNVIWIDFENSDYESYDGSHLHYNSAKKLSGIIGMRINELSQK